MDDDIFSERLSLEMRPKSPFERMSVYFHRFEQLEIKAQVMNVRRPFRRNETGSPLHPSSQWFHEKPETVSKTQINQMTSGKMR